MNYGNLVFSNNFDDFASFCWLPPPIICRPPLAASLVKSNTRPCWPPSRRHPLTLTHSYTFFRARVQAGETERLAAMEAASNARLHGARQRASAVLSERVQNAQALNASSSAPALGRSAGYMVGLVPRR